MSHIYESNTAELPQICEHTLVLLSKSAGKYCMLADIWIDIF